METIITDTIRTVRTGNSLDGQIDVYIKKDNQWQLSATFYQSDDLMTTKLQNHLEQLRNQS